MAFEMLDLVDVHAYYGQSHVLQGVSLSVARGSIVAVVGRNGMGKTTTLHSIMGFVPPRKGDILYGGENIARLPSHRIAQMGIALVPQGRRVFPSLSVKENLAIAARKKRGGGGWSLERVYTLFPVLKDRAKSKGNQVSGGEQQMLAIARALVTNPELLLMDEPSEGLAPMVVKEIARIIRGLKEEGLSILLVEQNTRMALALADYVYVISRGKVVYGSKPQSLSADEAIMSRYVGV